MKRVVVSVGVIAVLTVGFGWWGLLLGAAVLGAWVVLSVPYAIAIAALGGAILAPPATRLEPFLWVAAAVTLLVGGALWEADRDIRALVVGIGTIAVLSALGWWAIPIGGYWFAALVVLGVTGLGWYLLHRIDIVFQEGSPDG